MLSVTSVVKSCLSATWRQNIFTAFPNSDWTGWLHLEYVSKVYSEDLHLLLTLGPGKSRVLWSFWRNGHCWCEPECCLRVRGWCNMMSDIPVWQPWSIRASPDSQFTFSACTKPLFSSLNIYMFLALILALKLGGQSKQRVVYCGEFDRNPLKSSERCLAEVTISLLTYRSLLHTWA